ncbi:hypothetical protein [Streptosporangium roseum]|uniref:Uncharacterized protein n=1 Tax=Streptosporangium roseum (strain ATCC 12428 / DSM 43021 / JCM 3005 / KCTC 9067 / NCIMB 10171 / NRRL 2505 / NI 9100) TaxID=479432 RepID=D2BDM0_STRRD|nr:hypothetical protein [Streptosporangium roseum]ACZ88112.1 hypothetical protein Sros_5348 [Streptosporangium roseum DSM 43021]
METEENFERPSPAQAAAALETARQARASGYAPIPAWFFPALGLLVAGVMLFQIDIAPELGLLAVAGVIAGYVVTERVYNKQVSRSGIAPRQLTFGQQLVLATPLAALWVAGEILSASWDGVWLVAAAVGGCWTVGYGLFHNRRARTSV